MKETIANLKKTHAEELTQLNDVIASKDSLLERFRESIKEAQEGHKKVAKEYDDFVVRLAEYLGIIVSRDMARYSSCSPKVTVTADEIVFAIMKLKGYVERFEGVRQDVSVENSRLWYMMRVAMYDPSLTPESVRNGYLENSALDSDHYTRPSQDTQCEHPRDKFPY